MATLDDIKAVLEGIRADLGSTAPTSAPGMTARDQREHLEAIREHTEALRGQQEAAERASRANQDLEDTNGVLGERLGGMAGKYGKLLGRMNSVNGAAGLLAEGLGKITDGAIQVAINTKNMANELNAATTSLMASAGASDITANAMGKVAQATIQYGISVRDVSKATEKLMGNTFEFTQLTEQQQEALIKDAAMLNEVGVEFTDFADIVQMGTKTFQMSMEESTRTVYELRGAARDIGMPIDEFMRQLPQLADNLSNMGEDAIDAATAVLKLHKETGLAVDTMEKLDSQMYTFEGATKFAAGMNQALQGNFFDPIALMNAYEEGPEAITKLVKNTLNDAGVSISDMGRRELDFFAHQAGISVSEFRKLVEGDVGALDEEMGKHATTRAEAELDALGRMKSNTEALENMKNAMETLPVGPIEQEMRNIADQSVKTADNTMKFAKNMQLAFVEAHKTEMALAVIASNIADTAKDSAVGKIFAGLGLSILGIIGIVKKWFAPAAIKGWIGSMLGGIGSAISTAYTWVGVGLIDFFSMSFAGMATTVLALAMNIYAIVEAIMEVYDSIWKVIGAGGDWKDQLVSIPLSIGKGFATAFDMVTSGFGLLDEGAFSWVSRLLNPGGKSFLEAWEEIEWDFLGEAIWYGITHPLENLGAWFEGMGDRIVNAWNEAFGISSPSTVMMGIGDNMVDGLLSPFRDIKAAMEPIMDSMVEVIPAPIRNFLAGDTDFGDLAASAAASTSETVGNIIDAVTGNNAEQQIQVSFQLDGREVDKKILKVVGGVVQPLTR